MSGIGGTGRTAPGLRAWLTHDPWVQDTNYQEKRPTFGRPFFLEVLSLVYRNYNSSEKEFIYCSISSLVVNFRYLDS